MIPDGFDRELLRRITADNEPLAEELVDMLIADLPSQRTQLLEAQTHEELARVTHNLAGGAAYCGASHLKQHCIELENSLLQQGCHRDEQLQAVLDEIDYLLRRGGA